LPRLSAARRVESIMSTEVVTARPQQPLPELAKLFADGGRHHLPVLDEQRRVIGMMTPSDLLAVLFQTAPGPLTKA
jgi:CBS domain-containing membrane protein